MTAKPLDGQAGDAASSPPLCYWIRTLNGALLGIGRANTVEDPARRWQRFRADVAEVAYSLRPCT